MTELLPERWKCGNENLSAKIPLDHPPPTPTTNNRAASEGDTKPMDTRN